MYTKKTFWVKHPANKQGCLPFSCIFFINRNNFRNYIVIPHLLSHRQKINLLSHRQKIKTEYLAISNVIIFYFYPGFYTLTSGNILTTNSITIDHYTSIRSSRHSPNQRTEIGGSNLICWQYCYYKQTLIQMKNANLADSSVLP